MSETLYRGMDRDEIDRQLNLRARWPEHEEYFERWARDSAAARAQLDARLDLAYGASEGFKHGHGPLYGLGSHMSSSVRTAERGISSTKGPRRIQLQ